MAQDRLVLVVEDDRLGAAIQGSLREALGYPAARFGFDSVREHLGPGAEAVVLLAASSPAECEETVRLVQEVRLRQWPAAVLLVEGNDPSSSNDLVCLDPFVAGRFSWPGHAGALVEYLQGQPGLSRGRGPARPAQPTEEDWFAQQLLAQTPSLVPLAERLALAAAHEVTVLLTGETGTGKTHLARLIHEHSPRREHRLLVIPCGALASNLIESELFGHAKGAFTGADKPKVGKFEAAGAGTILLDEIDALGLEQQAKLLRVIETGEYEPVGSNEVKLCRARIIAASNWDLEGAAAEGRFRQDLYYRLNVLSFYLPPLRERVQDIAPLSRAMVVEFSKKFKKNLFTISDEAIESLEAFPWPGNIRQLENALQQAVLMSTGRELLREHLPPAVRDAIFAPPTAAASAARAPAPGSLAEQRDEQERRAIERALTEANNCRSRAAQALGVSRVTLYNKLKKYGLLEGPRPWPGNARGNGA
jgi:transcriptional regulator with PAS, ATPase and Fis domain